MTGLVDDPLMRHVLTSEERVSAAIFDAISRRKLQRVVPRWYYLLSIARLLAPPVYRFAQGPLATVRKRRIEE
jgi:hypothetical protein